MLAKPRPPEAEVEALAEAASLDALYGHLTPERIIERAVRDHFAGEIAAVSSFGADSAVLLNMIARHRPHAAGDLPRYRQAFRGDAVLSRRADRRFRPDRRARHQRRTRRRSSSAIPTASCTSRTPTPAATSARLSRWRAASSRSGPGSPAASASRPRRALHCRRSSRSVRASASTRWRAGPPPTRPTTCAAHALRENPLVAYGYLSIGCFPCTQPVQPGEDARSGRWAGQAKVECGIHLSGLDRSLTDASL